MKLPRPEPIPEREVKWEVYSDLTEEDLLKRITETALLCLVPRNYENLGLTMADIKRYILQLQAMVKAYEKLYVEADDEVPGD